MCLHRWSFLAGNPSPTRVGGGSSLLLELRDLAEHMSAQALHVRLFGHRHAPVALDRIEPTQLFLELLQ